MPGHADGPTGLLAPVPKVALFFLSAPTDEEKAQHYLWRFWRHVPTDGHVTVYDRSWYGRVLVERVIRSCFMKPEPRHRR